MQSRMFNIISPTLLYTVSNYNTASMLLIVIPNAMDTTSLSLLIEGAISAATLRTRGGFTAKTIKSFL